MRNLTIALVLGLAAAALHAQTPAAAPPGPPPTGLVVGSGNFFSPIVGDLDKALAFYRDGLGLDVQGTPSNAETNPALRNMFGLPDAQLRWPCVPASRSSKSRTPGANRSNDACRIAVRSC
jgi:hypothetical protein